MQALTTAGKDFEHEVSDVPGGHSFDRLDTPEAWGYRKQIYASMDQRDLSWSEELMRSFFDGKFVRNTGG